MDPNLLEKYNEIRSGRAGFYEQQRGLLSVHGSEAVKFLDGLITNDVKTLVDGGQMRAAFPNAQGRLLAVVNVLRVGERFLIETEAATHESLFTNLHRFTFAGDFFLEDLSANHAYFEIFGPGEDVYHSNVGERIDGAYTFEMAYGAAYFIPNEKAEEFRGFLSEENKCLFIEPELYETLRIESGIPLYGKDMNETTIVPELGIDGLISYNKGCYIGQEIIARIHFRGHVAKRLAGLMTEQRAGAPIQPTNTELTSADSKNAGRITSVTFSPKLDKTIALGFVRYDNLAVGTRLNADGDTWIVTGLPFVS